MYYILKCPFGQNGADPALLNYLPDDPRRLWDTGVKFSSDAAARPHKREPATPIKFSRAKNGEMKDMWEAPACVMSRKLADAFLAAGVKNIDFYDAVITDAAGRETTDYVAFNIVGLVDASDKEKSSHDPDINWFDKLVINPSLAGDSQVFRLKGATYQILVSESVKQHLEKAGFKNLEFLVPEKLTAGK